MGSGASPRGTSKAYHPNAEMNIRTKNATTGGHGNQATYDINGMLITTGLAAGSADYVQAGGLVEYLAGHRDYDVKTFELASKLDNFPASSTGTPQFPVGAVPGDNIKKYFEVRPVIEND